MAIAEAVVEGDGSHPMKPGRLGGGWGIQYKSQRETAASKDRGHLCGPRVSLLLNTSKLMEPDVAWGGEEGWGPYFQASSLPVLGCDCSQAENNTLPAQVSPWVVRCWAGQCLLHPGESFCQLPHWHPIIDCSISRLT